MKKVLTITILFSIVIILTSSLNNFYNRLMFFSVKINKDSLINSGIPERIVNQYVKVRESLKYMGKSFFVVDTRENLIYFFDENGKFITKTPTIDGFDKQSKSPTKVKETLQRWSKHAEDAGFKLNKITKSFIDTTGKNRLYTDRVVYNFLGQKKRRFFPKGVYIVKSTQSTKSFLGNGVNTYNIKTLDGKSLALAIHSLYKSQYRINSMNTLIKLVGSDFNETKVSPQFQKIVKQNINNGVFNNSFGCINVPLEFISLTKKKAVGSYIFVLGEDDDDYTI